MISVYMWGTGVCSFMIKMEISRARKPSVAAGWISTADRCF